MKRNILCIDLKSFYASVECIRLGLDPFKTPLVVANKKQGNGAITLAVTPCLKKQGVKSRSRLYDIPSNIKYHIVPSQMGLYVEKSKEIISIYLDFIDSHDLHVYSIDEAFLDVTNYLKLYNKTDKEIALMIMDTIKKKTGLSTACGIGDNMFLAKAALDNEAKNNKDNIAKWTLDNIENTLWKIDKLNDMWGIGINMMRNLNRLKIYTVYELAHADKNLLINHFGIIGEELWNHANGLDEAIISEKDLVVRNTSLSQSQILFKDYDYNNVKIIITEMIDDLVRRLRKSNKLCKVFSLGIGYSKNIGGGFYNQIKLDNYTSDSDILSKYAFLLLDKHYEDYPIRKVTVTASKLVNKNFHQLNLFDDYNEFIKKEKLENSKDIVKDNFGKNKLLYASSLLDDSTIQKRNNMIGGHSL